jgi:hypothetical protein
MKSNQSKIKTFFNVILVFISVNVVIGQNDSIKKLDQKKRYFKVNENDEIKHLFKVNLTPLIIYRPTIAFEQKIGKNFSFETSLSVEKYARLFFMSEIFIMDENKIPRYPKGFSVRGYQMFKYYYNYRYREMLGKIINGFSGNYIAIQLKTIYAKSKGVNNYWGDEDSYFSFVGLSTGFQRRIGNFFYINPSAFLDIAIKSNFETPPVFHLGFKLKMGFAIESLFGHKRQIE